MKTRMRFVKCGSMKFIGHLDCMRFFQKAIRRAKLDVAYSKFCFAAWRRCNE